MFANKLSLRDLLILVTLGAVAFWSITTPEERVFYSYQKLIATGLAAMFRAWPYRHSLWLSMQGGATGAFCIAILQIAADDLRVGIESLAYDGSNSYFADGAFRELIIFPLLLVGFYATFAAIIGALVGLTVERTHTWI